MDRLIYIAMTGAKHTMEQQAVVANNLANASTSGFKGQLAAFRAVPTLGPTLPTRTSVVDTTTGPDFSPGPLMSTGRPLDIAVKRQGWIAVQARDGTEAYTRDGGLQITANGVLQTRSGLSVIGTGGPISVPPNNMITIGEDGTVSAIPTDTTPNAVSIVGQLKLVNPAEADLVRGDDGLYRQSSGQAAPADPNVQVSSGVLEGSNVSPVEMLVQMITHARHFETQVKLLSTADANAQRWSQVLNLSA